MTRIAGGLEWEEERACRYERSSCFVLESSSWEDGRGSSSDSSSARRRHSACKETMSKSSSSGIFMGFVRLGLVCKTLLFLSPYAFLFF